MRRKSAKSFLSHFFTIIILAISFSTPITEAFLQMKSQPHYNFVSAEQTLEAISRILRAAFVAAKTVREMKSVRNLVFVIC